MIHKITKIFLLQTIIISLTFVVAEGLFYVIFLVNKSEIFDVLVHPKKSTYPFDNHQDYFKIAVFGGSSSAGYNSVINFTEILHHELKLSYPSVNFFIKNYSQNGDPFHRRQAEIVKNVIEKYDIFLIYTGHNELLNYIDNKQKIERVPEFDSSLIGFFEQRSRVYSIINKAIYKIFDFMSHDQDESVNKKIKQFNKFDYITDEIIFPNIEKEKIVNNFKNDLVEISLLAKKYKKQIYFSSARSNLIYWPMVSVYSRNLNKEEQSKFIQMYNSGLKSFRNGKYNEAIINLNKTKSIDDKVAVIDFLIGSSLFKIKKKNNGFDFLNASIDNDGYPVRSINALDDAVKEASFKYRNMNYVDTKAVFFNAVNDSIPFDILFSDFQHPAKLGHVLIAYAFLNKISNHPSLKKDKNPNRDFLITSKNYYQQLFHKYTPLIHPWKYPYNAYMKARWHIGSYNPSHSNDYINATVKNLKLFYHWSKKTNEDKSLHQLLSSIVSARRGNLSKSFLLANDSIKFSKTFAKDLVFGQAIHTGSIPIHKDKWIIHLNQFGIHFSEKSNKFFIKTK